MGGGSSGGRHAISRGHKRKAEEYEPDVTRRQTSVKKKQIFRCEGLPSLQQPQKEGPPPPECDTLQLSNKEEIKTLYVLMFLTGQISHSLYAFDIPADPKLPADVMAQVPNPKPASPILTFPSGGFPSTLPSGLARFPDLTAMGFVALDSKFYFLGGCFGLGTIGPSHRKAYKKAMKECKKVHPTHPYSAKVYVFDPAKAKVQDKPLDAGLLLGLEKDGVFQEVAAMKSGKPCLRAFVFDRKIYALGCSHDCATMLTSGIKFEYFEVYNPSTDKWSILPKPNWGKALLTCHAIIDKKLYAFVEDRDDRCQVYVFDLVKEKWIKRRRYSSKYLKSTPYMYEFVDNYLYWCPQYQDLTACGPISGETKLKNLFDNRVYILPDSILNFYEGEPIEGGESSESLIHFGNKRICHVCSEDPVYPEISKHVPDTDSTNLRINIFKPLFEKSYCGKGSAFPSVNSECVYSTHFVLRTHGSCFIGIHSLGILSNDLLKR